MLLSKKPSPGLACAEVKFKSCCILLPRYSHRSCSQCYSSSYSDVQSIAHSMVGHRFGPRTYMHPTLIQITTGWTEEGPHPGSSIPQLPGNPSVHSHIQMGTHLRQLGLKHHKQLFVMHVKTHHSRDAHHRLSGESLPTLRVPHKASVFFIVSIIKHTTNRLLDDWQATCPAVPGTCLVTPQIQPGHCCTTAALISSSSKNCWGLKSLLTGQYIG